MYHSLLYKPCQKCSIVTDSPAVSVSRSLHLSLLSPFFCFFPFIVSSLVIDKLSVSLWFICWMKMVTVSSSPKSHMTDIYIKLRKSNFKPFQFSFGKCHSVCLVWIVKLFWQTDTPGANSKIVSFRYPCYAMIEFKFLWFYEFSIIKLLESTVSQNMDFGSELCISSDHNSIPVCISALWSDTRSAELTHESYFYLTVMGLHHTVYKNRIA